MILMPYHSLPLHAVLPRPMAFFGLDKNLVAQSFDAQYPPPSNKIWHGHQCPMQPMGRSVKRVPSVRINPLSLVVFIGIGACDFIFNKVSKAHIMTRLNKRLLVLLLPVCQPKTKSAVRRLTMQAQRLWQTRWLLIWFTRHRSAITGVAVRLITPVVQQRQGKLVLKLRLTFCERYHQNHHCRCDRQYDF